MANKSLAKLDELHTKMIWPGDQTFWEYLFQMQKIGNKYAATVLEANKLCIKAKKHVFHTSCPFLHKQSNVLHGSQYENSLLI